MNKVTQLMGSNPLEKENCEGDCLEFVHITKNAGTAIETSGAKGGVAWGACHYLSLKICEGVQPDKHAEWTGGSPWHDPAYNNYTPNTKTFAVVRNPYDRAVSMYYYDVNSKKKTPMEIANNRKNFVEYILHVKNFKHAIPQSSYVFNEKGEKIIDHVLRYETLGTDGKFEALMKAYNLNVSLPEHQNTRKEGSKISPLNLPRRAIKVINDYYHDDFINFNYSKLPYFKKKKLYY